MDSIKDILKNLEEKLLKPKIRHSMKDLDSLLASEFREFASSGEIFNKVEVIASLIKEIPIERSLTEFNAMPLADEIVLVTYKVTKINASSNLQSNSLRSSIWRYEEGNWQMVFHQGTKLP